MYVHTCKYNYRKTHNKKAFIGILATLNTVYHLFKRIYKIVTSFKQEHTISSVKIDLDARKANYINSSIGFEVTKFYASVFTK